MRSGFSGGLNGCGGGFEYGIQDVCCVYTLFFGVSQDRPRVDTADGQNPAIPIIIKEHTIIAIV